MRARLADSLRHVAEAARHAVAVPDDALAGFLDRLVAQPVSPLVFGRYCDLVLALDADALDDAERLLAEIAASPPHADGLVVRALGDPRSDVDADRYRRLMDTDPDVPFTIGAPPPDVAQAARARLAEGLALLDAGFPALAAELRGLLREVVLAVGPEDAGAWTFDGASAFLLWGAVVLNAREHRTPLAMAQALAHESGHTLLFGLCADGPLVENDDAERFASPLRVDPRPMDGIVHAVYVVARMHLALRTLRDAGVLDAAGRADAERDLAAHVRAFAAGWDVVARHARLTPIGRRVTDAARRYMDASA